MKDALIVTLLSVLPRNRLSNLMGWCARSGLSRIVVRLFIKAYGVDMSECAAPIEAFSNLEEFFTRALKKGARPIDASDNILVSPADGTVAALGTSENGLISLTSKQSLHLPSLLGIEKPVEFDAIVIYLSPKDYHRVHSPADCDIVRVNYKPGTLWPVFPAAVKRVSGIFSKNERLVFESMSHLGTLYTVMVGAFGVGRITSHLSSLTSNAARPAASEAIEPRPQLRRGDELGQFHLGSTVVIVAPAGSLDFLTQRSDLVQVGQKIATTSKPTES